LFFEGGCHVDGTVKGNITADPDSNSALSISEDALVEGGVAVPFVMLNGIVRGDVFANQRVELGPTARVIGNVYYNLIEMAIGAEINGKLIHQPDGQVPLLEQISDDIEVPASATAVAGT
jgi:cytoskeletal protein CcmA (bactofilin family)